jgi:hypothetical protein
MIGHELKRSSIHKLKSPSTGSHRYSTIAEIDISLQYVFGVTVMALTGIKVIEVSNTPTSHQSQLNEMTSSLALRQVPSLVSFSQTTVPL